LFSFVMDSLLLVIKKFELPVKIFLSLELVILFFKEFG